MTPEQFAYWLQGYAELNGGPPSKEAWEVVKEHLNLVFKKVTKPIQKAEKSEDRNSDWMTITKGRNGNEGVTLPYIPPSPQFFLNNPEFGKATINPIGGDHVLMC